MGHWVGIFALRADLERPLQANASCCGSSGPNEARPWPEPRTQAVYQSWWTLLEWARWAAEVIKLSFMWPPWSFPACLPAAAFYSVYTSLFIYFSVVCVSDYCMIVELSLFLLLCTCGSLCQIVALQVVFSVSLSRCLSIYKLECLLMYFNLLFAFKSSFSPSCGIVWAPRVCMPLPDFTSLCFVFFYHLIDIPIFFGNKKSNSVETFNAL